MDVFLSIQENMISYALRRSRNCIHIQVIRNFKHVSTVGINDLKQELIIQLRYRFIRISIAFCYDFIILGGDRMKVKLIRKKLKSNVGMIIPYNTECTGSGNNDICNCR